MDMSAFLKEQIEELAKTGCNDEFDAGYLSALRDLYFLSTGQMPIEHFKRSTRESVNT